MAQPSSLCRHCGAALAVGAVACFRCGKLIDAGGPSETEAGKLPTRLGTMARGALLEERWRVVRPVGSNRVGTVWLGQDVTLDRPVSVLVVHPELGAEPGFPARFEARALKLAAIDERHLAQVLGVGKRDGAQYLVTRHAEGQTLAELQHAKGGRLPAPLATKVLSQLCDALGTLHAWGLAHGALTHANAVIGERDHLTLRDFGEALLAPPAQNSAAADLIALGALGYELLSGHPPAGPLPPRLTGVPDALAECVARCLAPGPPLRPISAVEVRGWLDRAGVAELLSGGLKIPVSAAAAPPPVHPSGASPGSAATSPSLEVVSDEESTDPNRARPSEISTDPLRERPPPLELSTQPSPRGVVEPMPLPRLDQLGTSPGVPGPAGAWQTGDLLKPPPGSNAQTAHLQPVATGETAAMLPPVSTGGGGAARLAGAPGETAAMLPPVSSAQTAALLPPVAGPVPDLQAQIGTVTMAPVVPTAETVDLAQPVLPQPSEAERREVRRKWILGAVVVALLAPGAFWLISPERDAALPPPPPLVVKRPAPPRPPEGQPAAAEAAADAGASAPAVAQAPAQTPGPGSGSNSGAGGAAADERPSAAPPSAPPPAQKPSGAKMIVMPSAVELNTDRPADLYKKGKLLGRTPLRTLLPPGANLLTVRPVGDGAAYEWKVEVEPPLKLEFFTSIQALRDEALQESLRRRSAAGQATAPPAP